MPAKKNHTWIAFIPAVLLGAGLVASFVRVQVHAEDDKQHLTREVLAEEYVPRPEIKRIEDKIDAIWERV